MKAQSATPGPWDPLGLLGGEEAMRPQVGQPMEGGREEEAGEERETEGRRVEGAPRRRERRMEKRQTQMQEPAKFSEKETDG